MSENKSKTIVVHYNSEQYDLARFIHKHPGGVNTLKGLENSDITRRFHSFPKHSNAALYLMNEYKIPTNYMNNKNNNINEEVPIRNGIEVAKQQQQPELSNSIKKQNSEQDLKIVTDESMEHLVDWSEAMLPQITKITDKYDEWVNKPVDRPLRLFGPWYLEILTKTPWWVVPLFWIPSIGYLINLDSLDSSTFKYTSIKIGFFIFGFILWTFIEYILHRFVFHMETTNNSVWRCTFHFMLHGLHHKVPFDSLRLVFPPVPAVLLASIFFIPIKLIFPCPKIILAGGLLGYLCYDMIHYYLHYGNPNFKYLYKMKRYHYQHHFVHHDLGFGISSSFWDLIFGTRICLNKLKYVLKW